MGKKDVMEKIDMLLEKANELKNTDSRQTIDILNYVLSLCEEVEYTLGEKVAFLYNSYVYINIGKYEEALPMAIDSLQHFVKEGFYDLQWMAYNTLGIIFYQLGDIQKSMDFYNNSQAVAMEIDLGKKYNNNFTGQKSMVLTLNNIAENYKALKEYREALNHCEMAYNIDEQFNYSLTRGLTILSLGEIYYLLGEYEKASDLSYKAIEYLKKYNYNIAIADAYKLMALNLWKMGHYEKSEEYFYIAIHLNEKESIPNYRINALIDYYEYLKDREKLTEALEILINACELAKEYKIPERVSEISILIAIFYGNLGDYENALKYTKLHYEYEEAYSKSYCRNIVNSLKIKKKMKEIEKENNEIIERNRSLKIQKQSLQVLVEKISIISELGQKITSTLNIDSIMNMVYSSIKSFMNLSYFAIGLYDENNSIINYLYAMDRGEKCEKHSISINDGQTFAGNCIKNRELIIINNISDEFTKYIDKKTYDKLVKLDNNAELNSLIFCPLIVNTKIIGIITIQSKEKDSFNLYYIEMVKSLSAYAAIAINNAIKSMELENLNEVLLSLSEKDELTGIANRRKFDDYINYVWDVSIEKGSDIALLIIDIDYFKEYNDNLGHLEGDKCIASVANTLANLNSRPYFVARYGGDEFVIVLPECSIDDAVKFGNDIEAKIAELNIPHRFSKVSNKITLSIGVASAIPIKDISINELIKRADNALYISKKRGRNQVSVRDLQKNN
ncbi:GGDEF domain-containing protein [Clostridium sp.]|uniref:sensor domain-containing diguanylate cyclase n=1 Tax=Clostridium sp. TaxID=1506 RepID=UPI00284FDDA7|nr:GGDEF domain-containing protein [Clostridium sp.]MDR3595903.1 GGDEF domain-containing protein [Clostridium sp.]